MINDLCRHSDILNRVRTTCKWTNTRVLRLASDEINVLLAAIKQMKSK